ncbi:tetratricopeptide repeat protein [Arcticibacter sp. MXS-1]|uniref:tetratricopeptide repeat protein n=1 Tax=Arcticibacter sp. MXS-1 TaxID=3341726 RepID=UPI0035A934E7
MLKKILVLLLIGVTAGATAQENDKFFIVTGKPLSTADSTQIKRDFFNALQQKTAGRYGQAATLFKKIIEADPQNDAALFELSAIYHAQNNEEQAEDCARRAVTVNPDNKWYWLLLTEIYKKKNALDQLVEVFNELIRIEPDERNYYFDKANALFLLSRTKESESVYKEIEDRFGGGNELEEARQKLALLKEDPRVTIRRLQAALKDDPSNINHYLNLAELYIKTNKHDKALQLLKKARKSQPDNSFVHLLLSDIYQAREKTSQAFEEIKLAFADKALPIDIKVQIILSYFGKLKDPEIMQGALGLAEVTAQTHALEPKAQALYGDVLFQAQQLEAAKNAYKKALALNNKVYLIWAQLLQIEIAQSEFEAAVQDGEAALNIFPHEPDLYFFTGTAYAQSGRHEKAVNAYKNALSLNPKKWVSESDIYSSLGSSLNSLKRFKESDEAFEASLKLNADNVYTLNNYAYFLSLRGEKLEKAAELSRRSNELKPGNASFEDTYAWVLFRLKKFAQARTWIEKAIKSNSNSAVQYEHYGDILYHLGEKESAVEQWQIARDKGVKSETLEKKINEKQFFE